MTIELHRRIEALLASRMPRVTVATTVGVHTSKVGRVARSYYKDTAKPKPESSGYRASRLLAIWRPLEAVPTPEEIGHTCGILREGQASCDCALAEGGQSMSSATTNQPLASIHGGDFIAEAWCLLDHGYLVEASTTARQAVERALRQASLVELGGKPSIRHVAEDLKLANLLPSGLAKRLRRLSGKLGQNAHTGKTDPCDTDELLVAAEGLIEEVLSLKQFVPSRVTPARPELSLATGSGMKTLHSTQVIYDKAVHTHRVLAAAIGRTDESVVERSIDDGCRHIGSGGCISSAASTSASGSSRTP